MTARIVVALALVLPRLAAAQDRPPTLPTRDVAVAYRVADAAAHLLPGATLSSVQLAWDAAGRRLRVAADGQPQAAILDLAEHRAVILVGAMHAAITVPLRAADTASIALKGARFRRTGVAEVAGHACTEYAVQDQHGAGTLCLTADGVPLRGDGTWNGQAARFEAMSVTYAKQPDANFQLPPGYLQLAMPKTLGTMDMPR